MQKASLVTKVNYTAWYCVHMPAVNNAKKKVDENDNSFPF